MKQFFFLACVLVFATAKSQADSREIQLGSMSPNFGNFHDNPLSAITLAVERVPNANRFRCSWSDRLGSGWDRGTMIYDKKRGIVKSYRVGGAGEMGEQFYRSSLLFTGVKPTTLQIIAKKFKDALQKDYQRRFIFEELLPRHGARKYELEEFKRGF